MHLGCRGEGEGGGAQDPPQQDEDYICSDVVKGGKSTGGNMTP